MWGILSDTQHGSSRGENYHAAELHKCTKCDAAFPDLYELQVHCVRNHRDVRWTNEPSHSNDNDNWFQFPKCAQNFQNNDALQLHHLNRHRNPPTLSKMRNEFDDSSYVDLSPQTGRCSSGHHECLYCIQAFDKADKLRVHMLTSHSIRCEDVSRLPRNQGDSQTSSTNRIRTKDPMYSCPYCSQPFTKEDDLQVHVLTAHHETKSLRKEPTFCTGINCFANGRALEEPLECPFFPETFTESDNLEAHMLSSHKGALNELNLRGKRSEPIHRGKSIRHRLFGGRANPVAVFSPPVSEAFPFPMSETSAKRLNGGDSKRDHRRATNGDYRYPRPYCHGPTMARRHCCSDCHQTFASPDDLEVHVLTAHYRDESPQIPPYGEFSFHLLPPIKSITPDRLGEFRGIQGENNSCYLDASLVSMFALDDTFDFLLLAPSRTCSELDLNVEFARRYLQTMIVNNLRSRGFVPSSSVFEWRRMISAWFGGGTDPAVGFDTYCQEEEACEFIRFLLTKFGQHSGKFRFMMQPKYDFVAGDGCFKPVETAAGEDAQVSPILRGLDPLAEQSVEVVIPSDEDNAASIFVEDELQRDEDQKPTSLSTAEQDLCKCPAASGQQVPAGELMLQLLAPANKNPPKGVWSIQELLDDTLNSEGLVFTKYSNSLILQLPRYGKNHRVVGPVVPNRRVYCHMANGQKIAYELKSVLVIGRSHFIAYLRHQLGADAASWYYFDSMSDRVSNVNIPRLEDVSHQMLDLECDNAQYLVQDKLYDRGHEHLRRVIEDLSLAIYKQSSLSLCGTMSSNGVHLHNVGAREHV